MRESPKILIVDDRAENVEIFRRRLAAQGYDIISASDGEIALNVAKEARPDLILLDIMMPKVDGIEVCRTLKNDPSMPFCPIIIVSAKSGAEIVVEALNAGADEYLTKPVDLTSLAARVNSMLRIKGLHDQSQQQAKQLEAQAAELAEANNNLEQRVAEQLKEIERMSQLKRFFSPQLAELIASSGGEKLLNSHRREITVVFCDLRGFTAFSDYAEPEEVMEVLQDYHSAVGPVIFQYGATLEHFAGDGIVAFLNDPVPCPDAAARGTEMAVAMKAAVGKKIEKWKKRGFELGCGIGVALGYATLGQIGFEGRFHYGAIGSVLNLASRLCDKAANGQILVTQRVYAEIEDLAEVEPMGELEFKGFVKPVSAVNVVSLKSNPVLPPTPGRADDATALT